MGSSRTQSNFRGTWRMRRSSTADLVRFWSKSEERGVEFYGKVRRLLQECFAETGRAPVGTKWVHVNKGTAENPNIRCMQVGGQGFQTEGREGSG